MTPDSWLEAHPYLRPLADFAAEVDRTTCALEIVRAPAPAWADYHADFLAGVTLLHSADAGIDLEPGGRTAAALIEKLAVARSSGWLAAETRSLHAELQRQPHAERRIVDFLLGDESTAPSFPGLLRYLGWTAMARFLAPVVLAFRTCATRSNGSAGIARPADRHRQWHSSPVKSPGAGVYCRADAAELAGTSRAPAARSVDATLNVSRA